MSVRSLLATTALFLAAVTPSVTAGAQARCTYDACALRLERDNIVRGMYGERVLRIRGYTDVARLVDWRTERAREEAATYVQGHRLASNLRLLGFAADVASTIISYQVYRDYRRQVREVREQQAAGGPVTTQLDLQEGKLAIGTGLTVAALVSRWSARRFDAIARAHLARAMWWHNREYVR
jgi:hypothetical protein